MGRECARAACWVSVWEREAGVVLVVCWVSILGDRGGEWGIWRERVEGRRRRVGWVAVVCM